MMSSSPPTAFDHLAEIRAARLALFERVIGAQLVALAQPLSEHRRVGAAVALDAQGRLLSRRLADTRPEGVAVLFLPRATSLDAARESLAAAGERVVAVGHPELLSQLNWRPMVAMGWSGEAEAEQWLFGLLEYLAQSDQGSLSADEGAYRLQMFADLLDDVEADAGQLPEDFHTHVARAARLSRPWLAHVVGDREAALAFYQAGLDKYTSAAKYSIAALRRVAMHTFVALFDQGRLEEAVPYARELLGRTFGLPDGQGQIKGLGLLLDWLDTAPPGAIVIFTQMVAQAALAAVPPETEAGISILLGQWLASHNKPEAGEALLQPVVAYYRGRGWPDKGESLRLLAEARRQIGQDVSALEAECRAIAAQGADI